MKLEYIALEGFTLTFAQAAQDHDLVEEIQLLLRAAGCCVSEMDGFWDVDIYAAMAVFCAVHNLTISGITPAFAMQLLAYRELING